MASVAIVSVLLKMPEMWWAVGKTTTGKAE
jgi:hypothetical protein